MTALERLNARPGPIPPSRRRASARTAIVRSNSDTTTQNEPAFHSAAGVRAVATITLRPASSRTSHLAPIEIP
jgi:hypothetical protein